MEALHEVTQQLAACRRQGGGVEVIADRKVLAPPRDAAPEIPVHFVDRIPEVVARLEPPTGDRLVAVGQLDDGEPRGMRRIQRLRRFAVNEFGAELERHRRAWVVDRQHAAADPGTRFDDRDAQTGLRQVARRGESRGAGAEHHDIRLLTIDAGHRWEATPETGVAARLLTRLLGISPEPDRLAYGNSPRFARILPAGGHTMPNPDFSNVRSGSSSTDSTRTYVVKQGDSLSKIAKQVYGNTDDWRRIYDANREIIKDPDLIYPGQTLRLP